MENNVKTALDAKEEKVLNLIAETHNAYMQLDAQHPSEPLEFTNAIHTMQNLMAMRIARKYHPELFPVKTKQK